MDTTLSGLLQEQTRLAQQESRARRALESLEPEYGPPADMAEYHRALTRWRGIAAELEQVNRKIGAHYGRN